MNDSDREAASCEVVREKFWRLVGLTEAERRSGFPLVVEHLRRCDDCRERLAAIALVALEDEAGVYGPPVFADPERGATAKPTPGATAVPLLAEPLRVEHVGGMPRFTRGQASDGSRTRARVGLARTGLVLELAVAGGDPDLVDLAIVVSGKLTRPLTARLLSAATDPMSVVHGSGPADLTRFASLPTGRYQLSITETDSARRYTVDIEIRR